MSVSSSTLHRCTITSNDLRREESSITTSKSLLSEKEPASGFGESAVVHYAQSGLASFSDGAGESDYDSAVVRTVETLSVVGSDAPTSRQEKEARSEGGIQSQ
ncbi:MAG: hypothetical protein PVJ05_00560 [Candidatus Thorarchaeota archaeon]